MTEIVNCWCGTCDRIYTDAQAMNGDWLKSLCRPFIVCPDCGNKRCPRAWHHDNDCAESNDVGQHPTRDGIPVGQS